MANATPKSDWIAFEGGATIGTIGSEQGLILRDEENQLGARITLERDGHHPYGITCGIYGLFVHTAFASNAIEAADKYNAMKSRLAELLAHEDNRGDELRRFIEEF